MLIKLIRYEFVKRWKGSRYVLLGYLLLQTLLLVMTRCFFWNHDIIQVFAKKVFEENDTSISLIGVPFGLTMLLFLLLAIFIGLFPFIEGLSRYDKDLSGKQSVLERMLPIVSWKKIVFKAGDCSLQHILRCRTGNSVHHFIHFDQQQFREKYYR